MGLCKSDPGVTMAWAHTHIWTPTLWLDNNQEDADGIMWNQSAFVIRGPEGSLDVLG
jgi:hypothetical protein